MVQRKTYRASSVGRSNRFGHGIRRPSPFGLFEEDSPQVTNNKKFTKSMSKQNDPNRDHWKDLVASLNVDVKIDDSPSKEEVEPVAPCSVSPKTTPCDSATSKKPAVSPKLETTTEPASLSKVDPLFDLGWNTPVKEEKVAVEKAPEVKRSEKPSPTSPKAEHPKKPRREPEHRGFGFGLLPEQPEKEPVVSEEKPFLPKEKPVEKPVSEVKRREEVSREDKVSLEDLQGGKKVQDDTEGASDWMALAAQLGVPIRSEAELASKKTSPAKPVTPEEKPETQEQEPFAFAEEYDPLAAWESPAPPRRGRKSREKETTQGQEALSESIEFIKAESSEQKESIIIGKPKEEAHAPRGRNDRGRGRRRDRNQDRGKEAESEKPEDEELLVEEAISFEEEEFEEEDEASEGRASRERRRRRRPRRNRKASPVESESESELEEHEPVEKDQHDDFDDDLEDEDEDDDDALERSRKSHRGIPSWEETIGMVVDRNLGTRSSRPDESRGSRSRGGRGRSGRRGGGRSKD